MNRRAVGHGRTLGWRRSRSRPDRSAVLNSRAEMDSASSVMSLSAYAGDGRHAAADRTTARAEQAAPLPERAWRTPIALRGPVRGGSLRFGGGADGFRDPFDLVVLPVGIDLVEVVV